MSRFTDDMFTNATKHGRGLVDDDGSTFTRRTWAEIHQVARQISGALAEAGIGRGDAVALLAGQPIDVAATIQALWMRGASVTMLHQPTPRTDMVLWAKDTEAVVSVINAKLVILGAPFEIAEHSLSNVALTTRFIPDLRIGSDRDPLFVDEDDIALLQLTSGSTGMPKAVAITHSNLYHGIQAIVSGAAIDPEEDVTVSWLPLFHDMGMVGFLILPMQIGMEAVCTTPLQFLRSPLIWVELITRYRGTMTAAPNFAYSVLAKRLMNAPNGAYNLSSLRWTLNGAEPVDADTVNLFISAGARFGLRESAIVAAYGMAEATLAISFTPVGEEMGVDRVDRHMLESSALATPSNRDDARCLVCLGPLLPGLEARVVDDAGTVRGSIRTVGEIQIRGKSVTKSYLTTEGPKTPVDANGWLDTGDLGYFTESGEIVICGRRKDTIIVAGRNIFPTDIERAAARVRGVRPGNAVAVRLVDPYGHREGFGVAVESLSHTNPLDTIRMQKEIARAVFEAVGINPTCVTVVEPGSIPKTPSGKLRRAEAAHLVRF